MTEAGRHEPETLDERQEPFTAVFVLRALLDHLRDGKALDEAARGFAIDALRDWQDDALSLDQAFGLRRWGGVPAAKEDRLARRNALLRRLRQTTPAWRDMTPYAAAGVMAIAAARYTATRWPRERDNVAAPSAEPATTWWRILTLGVSIPKGRMLERILADE